MPNYQDFCATFYDYRLPLAHAVDKTLRALSLGMRDAITRHLGVPEGSAQYATEISGIPTKYVELYRLNTQPNGLKTPAPLDVDEGFYFANENYRFCIGVCVERPESPSDGAVFVEFRVEECGELWATLVVENIQGSMLIRLLDMTRGGVLPRYVWTAISHLVFTENGLGEHFELPLSSPVSTGGEIL